MDSGASGHLTGNKAWFSELHPCAPCTVTTADHGVLTCTQRGTVVLDTPSTLITLRDVLYVPSLAVNLISVSALVKAGVRLHFAEKGCTLRTKRNGFIVRAAALNSIYSVHAALPQLSTAYSVTAGTSEAPDWVTLHARMGHLNPRSLS